MTTDLAQERLATDDGISANDYILGDQTELAREQLGYLAELFDPPTRTLLSGLGLSATARCLEIGAGAGTVSGWLAEQLPRAAIVAADIDLRQLRPAPGVAAVQHDLNTGVPVGGPFDLIVGRAVLMHLTERENILARLIDALAPGGWLVLADCAAWGVGADEVLSVRNVDDRDLYNRVSRVAMQTLLPATGVDFDWADRTDALMQQAGLVNLHGLKYQLTMTGGHSTGLLNQNYYRQAREPLLAAGADPDDLERFDQLMTDPLFRAELFRMTFTAGQHP